MLPVLTVKQERCRRLAAACVLICAGVNICFQSVMRTDSAYLNEGKLDVENQTDPERSHGLSSSISFPEDNH